MKVVLALLGGAVLGAAAVRLRSSLAAPASVPAVAPGSAATTPDRVTVDVSPFAD